MDPTSREGGNSNATNNVSITLHPPKLYSDPRWFFSESYTAPIYVESSRLVGLTNVPDIRADVLYDTFFQAFGDVLFCQLLPPSKAIVCFESPRSATAAVVHQSLVLLEETITVTSLNRGTPEPLLVTSYYLETKVTPPSPSTFGGKKTDDLIVVVPHRIMNEENKSTKKKKRKKSQVVALDSKQDNSVTISVVATQTSTQTCTPIQTPTTTTVAAAAAVPFNSVRQRRPSVKDRVLDIERFESERNSNTSKRRENREKKENVKKTKGGQSEQPVKSTTFTFTGKSPTLNAASMMEGTALNFMIGDDDAAAVVAESLRKKEENEKDRKRRNKEDLRGEERSQARQVNTRKQEQEVPPSSSSSSSSSSGSSNSSSFARERKSTAEEETIGKKNGIRNSSNTATIVNNININKGRTNNKPERKQTAKKNSRTPATANKLNDVAMSPPREAKLDDTPKKTKKKTTKIQRGCPKPTQVRDDTQIVEARRSKKKKNKKIRDEKRDSGGLSDSSDDLQYFNQVYVSQSKTPAAPSSRPATTKMDYTPSVPSRKPTHRNRAKQKQKQKPQQHAVQTTNDKLKKVQQKATQYLKKSVAKDVNAVDRTQVRMSPRVVQASIKKKKLSAHKVAAAARKQQQEEHQKFQQQKLQQQQRQKQQQLKQHQLKQQQLLLQRQTQRKQAAAAKQPQQKTKQQQQKRRQLTDKEKEKALNANQQTKNATNKNNIGEPKNNRSDHATVAMAGTKKKASPSRTKSKANRVVAKGVDKKPSSLNKTSQQLKQQQQKSYSLQQHNSPVRAKPMKTSVAASSAAALHSSKSPAKFKQKSRATEGTPPRNSGNKTGSSTTPLRSGKNRSGRNVTSTSKTSPTNKKNGAFKNSPETIGAKKGKGKLLVF